MGRKAAALQILFLCLQNFLLVTANNLDTSFKLQLVLVLGKMDIKEVLPYTYKIFSNMPGCTESGLLYVYHEYANAQHEELHFKQRQKLSRHICNQSRSIAEGKQHFKFSLWMII